MTKKKIESPSSLLDVEDIFDVSLLPSLPRGSSVPQKSKEESKPKQPVEQRTAHEIYVKSIEDQLVDAKTYIAVNNLEPDFVGFTQRLRKREKENNKEKK